MRDYEKFRDRLIALAIVYDKELPEAVFDIYWEALKDHPDDLVHEALSQGVKFHWRFMPRPAEINELCDKIAFRRKKGLENAKYEQEMLEWKRKKTENRLEQRREFKKMTKPVLELVESVAEKMDVRSNGKPEFMPNIAHED